MKKFLRTISYRDYEKVVKKLKFKRKKISMNIEDSAGYILAEDIKSKENIPGFSKSTMDGFAIKAKDSQGVSESTPGMLKVVKEINMGEVPDLEIKSGETVRIYTGGVLPKGSDAVIMIEDTEETGDFVEIYKRIGEGENIIRYDEDIKKDEIICSKNTLLNVQKIQSCLATGITEVIVFEKLKIAIISTGDEIIDYREKIRNKGFIRDTNSFILKNFLLNLKENVMFLGIVNDNENEMIKVIEKNINKFNLFLISGGSSMGARDITENVLSKFSEIIFHGMRVSPGKPVIFGKSKEKIFLGLPGHPVSSFISAYTVVKPLILRLENSNNFRITPSGYLRIDRNISKKIGRESFIPAKKYLSENNYFVKPLIGESGLISLIKESSGFIRISENQEGVYKGNEVEYYEI